MYFKRFLFDVPLCRHIPETETNITTIILLNYYYNIIIGIRGCRVRLITGLSALRAVTRRNIFAYTKSTVIILLYFLFLFFTCLSYHLFYVFGKIYSGWAPIRVFVHSSLNSILNETFTGR